MSPMKTLVAGLAIFSAATAVQADSTTATKVRITGSTAYRGATHTAIKNIYDTSPAPVVYGYVGTSFTGASQAIFYGTINGVEVIVETGWSGSVGGVDTVTNNKNVNFLADTLVNLGGPLTTGGASGLAAGTNSQIPDVAMSDTFQNATPFTIPSLDSTKVGVVPFKWVVSRGLSPTSINVNTTSGTNVASVANTASLSVGMTISGNANIAASGVFKVGAIINSTDFTILKMDGTVQNAAATASGVATSFVTSCPITNITPQQAQVLFRAGSCALALFTGNSADKFTNVFAIGRDPDSGTRLTAFAEAGVGVSSVVKQYLPTVSSGAVTSQVEYPGATINGLPVATGNNGYSSGGTLAGVMGNTTSAINGYYVTYLSTGDATTAINAGAKEIAYNGVTYSLSAMQQGLYTFWSYEHVMYQGTLDSTKKAVATALINRLRDNDATVLLGSMDVSRQSDGGSVTQKY